METKTATFTEQELNDQWYVMETAALECSIKEGLNEIPFIFASKKNVGVYYLTNLKSEWVNGKPSKIYFKKDFR